MDTTAGIGETRIELRPPLGRRTGRRALLAGTLALGLVTSTIGPLSAHTAQAGLPSPSESSGDNPSSNSSNQPDAWQHMTPPPPDLDVDDPNFGGPCDDCAEAAAGGADDNRTPND